jgi:outer membrane receptor protein involved in Fe transport
MAATNLMQSRRLVLAVIFGVVSCACACAGPALADGPDKPTTLEKVEVVGHYDTGIGTSDAASSGHITPQLIDERPLLRPGEVLEYIPGMIVTQHSGPGKANQYFLRGFNLDHGTDFETTVAGMPVNMRSHAHGQGYSDLNFLIPELIARIDYYKGPYYAQQGDFATAGSADIHIAESLPQNLAEGAFGSDQYGRVLLAGSPAFGPGKLIYGFEAFHDNGPFDNPENYRKYNGVLRYTQMIPDGKVSITGMGYTGRWNATDQIAQRAVDDGMIDRFGSLDASDGGKSSRYSLSGDLQKNMGGGQLQSTVYGIRYRLDLYSNFTYLLDDPVHGDQINQHDDRKIYGWNGSWSRNDKLFGFEMHNRIGWDVRYDDVNPAGLYHTEQRQLLNIVRQDRVKEASAGLYVENETHWTSWLRSIAGLRGDRYNFHVDDLLIPQNSGSRQAGQGSPKLSLIAGPWYKTETFLNFGEGFHSNDGRGTTTRIDPNTGDSVAPVTPLVRAKGAELGMRTELIPNLQSSVALWYLHLDSELVLDADAGTNVPGRPSKRTGIEWSNHYKPLKWLLLDLDVAYTRARFSDDNPVGNHIPEALKAAVSAGITVHDLGPWTASLFGRYFGPRALIEDASVNSQSTILFNTQVTYKAAKNLKLRFDVFNIFDRRDNDIAYYYASRLPGEPAAGVNDIHFHPTESRSFRLAALYSF